MDVRDLSAHYLCYDLPPPRFLQVFSSAVIRLAVFSFPGISKQNLLLVLVESLVRELLDRNKVDRKSNPTCTSVDLKSLIGKANGSLSDFIRPETCFAKLS